MTFTYECMNANMYTPLAVHKRLNAHFLLESASLENGKGRYSIIVRNVNFALKKVVQNSKDIYTFEHYENFCPKQKNTSYNLAIIDNYTKLPPILEAHKEKIHALVRDGRMSDFFSIAKIFQDTTKGIPEELAHLPLPLCGLGFVAYEFFSECEKMDFNQETLYDAPQALLVFPQECIVFDHFYDEMYLIVHTHTNTDIDIKAQLNNLKNNLVQSFSTIQTQKLHNGSSVLESQIIYEDSKEWFDEHVGIIKDEIYKGTFLQCVLSRALAIKSNMNPLYFYETLRRNNPSPYMYYLDFGDFKIIGASPEVMIQCKQNTQVLRPIAGTRKRGATLKQDHELMLELLADEKENAEHLMLVDLGRNDIGKTAQIGTVKLNAYKVVEKYSSVMHIVSEVSAQIKEGKSASDCFKACFPAGTVSGAPKIEAIKKLAQYEKHTRSIYSGAIFYCTPSGDLDSAITLRSAVHKDDVYYLQAGAGIVIDSCPKAEYIETCNKMKALYDILLPEQDVNKDIR